MRFVWLLVALVLAAGCAREKSVEERARELATALAKRIKGFNTNFPKPEMDPEGPPNPDLAAIARESAKITSLKLEDIVVGSGRLASKGKTVYLRYRGELPDGFVFESNRKPSMQLLSFTVGDGTIVAGFDQGVTGMRVGGRRKVTIPAHMGYGANPRPGSRIPPNAALIFYLDLMFVTTPKEE
ncbi:MAG: FKBP-type peptidyl-prolyl cis-trans isomerase [Fimbriimonadales bacterium]